MGTPVSGKTRYSLGSSALFYALAKPANFAVNGVIYAT